MQEMVVRLVLKLATLLAFFVACHVYTRRRAVVSLMTPEEIDAAYARHAIRDHVSVR